jgi:site-specific recombinase XerD
MRTATALGNKPRSPFAQGLSAMNTQRKGWAAKVGVRLEDLLDAFMRRCDREQLSERTKEYYELNINQRFFEWLRQPPRRYVMWSQVNHTDVQRFLEELQNSDRSQPVKVQVLRCLKTLFRFINDDRDMQAAGCENFVKLLPKIPKIDGRVWIPSPQEVQAFISAFDQDIVWGLRDYVMCNVILSCGARAGELCNMRTDYIDWDTNRLTLDGKTGKRVVSVDGEITIPLLKKWMRVRDRLAKGDGLPFVFVTRNGGPLTVNAIDHQFEKHRRATGIGIHEEGCITPHVLRHYYCTYYLVNGGTLHMLQRVTGHTELETLMLYVHLAEQVTAVTEEQNRVSPLKNLAKNATTGDKKKRKMY